MSRFFRLATVVGCCSANLAYGAVFVPLGDLPGGIFQSEAFDVSADGSVVVGEGHSANGIEAFRWTSEGGMVGLGYLSDGDSFSSARGISADGSVIVGGSGMSFEHEAFRWTSEGGMVGLGTLPESEYSLASDVSANGSVIVGPSGYQGSCPRCVNESFRWKSGDGMVGLNFIGYGVSANGLVVVGLSHGPEIGNTIAVRWTSEDGKVGLGDLPNRPIYSSANAVSADGSVIVGRFNPVSDSSEAFRWTSDDGMVSLGTLPDSEFGCRSANDVSADGSVVVGICESAFGNEAFRWDSVNGMQSVSGLLTGMGIDLTGWTLDEATGVSADGNTIVGNGINPSGDYEPWLATVPEPSTTTTMFIALALSGIAMIRGNALRAGPTVPSS